MGYARMYGVAVISAFGMDRAMRKRVHVYADSEGSDQPVHPSSLI